MADNPLGIGGRSPSGADMLKEVLGLKTPRTASASLDGGATAGSTKGGPFGARGKRMLPADYPEAQLDHGAARGTYLDILV